MSKIANEDVGKGIEMVLDKIFQNCKTMDTKTCCDMLFGFNNLNYSLESWQKMFDGKSTLTKDDILQLMKTVQIPDAKDFESKSEPFIQSICGDLKEVPLRQLAGAFKVDEACLILLMDAIQLSVLKLSVPQQTEKVNGISRRDIIHLLYQMANGASRGIHLLSPATDSALLS